MFARRVLTTAVLLAGFVAAILWLDAAGFLAVIALVVAFAAREWARLAGYGGAGALGYALGCTLAFVALALGLQPLRPAPAALVAIWTAALMFWLGVVPLWLARGVSASSRPWLPVAGLAVLVPAALVMVGAARGMLLALLGLVWIADTAAYLAGRAFGRRKLAPTISPGKTWAGAAGGTLGSLAYAIIVASCWPEIGRHVGGAVWIAYLAGAAILSGMSILGDLFESAVKRLAGVKDSGDLLPGHGGVLDRIDSVTAVLPAGALLVAWMGGA